MRFSLFILCTVIGFTVLAQAPFINNVSSYKAAAGEEIIISGSGFGTNPAQIQVWFGAVNATPSLVENSLIKTTVPTGASFDYITVINTNSRLLAHSPQKFQLVFGGVPGKDNFVLPTSPDFEYTSVRELYNLCACDLDGDGKVDLMATKFQNLATDIVILRNTSTLDTYSFQTIDQTNQPGLNINSANLKITCGDLDGDGKPEIVISKTTNPSNLLYVFRNTSTVGNIQFAPFFTLSLPSSQEVADNIKIHDLDGDGKADITVTNRNSNAQLYIFRNTTVGGVLSINATPQIITIQGLANNSSSGIDFEDLNNDGRPDMVVTPNSEKNIAIFENSSAPGTISFKANTLITTVNNIDNVKLADLNGDGKADIIYSQVFQNRIGVRLNTSTAGGISFQATSIFKSTPGGPFGLEVQDFNGDGKLDIVVTKRFSNEASLLINETVDNATTLLLEELKINTGNNSWYATSTDLNGDGKPDFAFTSFKETAPTLFKLIVFKNNHCLQPAIRTDGTAFICNGQTKRLETKPSPGTTFTWFIQGNGTPLKSGAEPFLDIITGGTYTVVADKGACNVVSANFLVQDSNDNAPSSPTVSAPAAAVCEGSTVNLVVTNPDSNFEYVWSGPNGFERVGISINTDPLFFGYVYKVRSRPVGGNCLSAATEVIVPVESFPEFNLEATNATFQCVGGSVNLRLNTIATYSFQWLRDGEAIVGATSNTYAATQSGIYSVRINTSQHACTSETQSIEVTIVENNTPQFSLTGECAGEPISFTNQSTIQEGQTIEYLWNFGSTQTPNTAATENPIFTYSAAGTYTVSLTIRYPDANCQLVGSQSVTILPKPVVKILADNIESSEVSICEGDAVGVILSPDQDYPGILWTFNGGIPSTELNRSARQAGVYRLEVTTDNGCVGFSEITVRYYTLPADVPPSANPQIVQIGNTSRLRAPDGYVSYAWFPANDLDNPNVQETNARPLETTNYLVTMTTADGCIVTRNVTVNVDMTEKLVAPKSFSPNGDGINELWVIPGVDRYIDCTLSIYDRNGRKVFEQKGYNNNWDGTSNGGALQAGTYYYVMACPAAEVQTGYVLLIR